jgi:hypothetical protein
MRYALKRRLVNDEEKVEKGKFFYNTMNGKMK